MAGQGSLTSSGAVPVVTAADMVAGHVTLDISCLDRIYLAGFVPALQTSGGVVYFLHDHRGNPVVSPAVFEQIGNRFRTAMRAWTRANNIPVVPFKAGERKADVMAPIGEHEPVDAGRREADRRCRDDGPCDGRCSQPGVRLDDRARRPDRADRRRPRGYRP